MSCPDQPGKVILLINLQKPALQEFDITLGQQSKEEWEKHGRYKSFRLFGKGQTDSGSIFIGKVLPGIGKPVNSLPAREQAGKPVIVKYFSRLCHPDSVLLSELTSVCRGNTTSCRSTGGIRQGVGKRQFQPQRFPDGHQ